ncbi:MAG: hypothetical protein LUI10_14050 [Lachnospiraceae bacterium]|nr:hypothetical protein [Lachnospiraceae bacterium]
MLKTVRISVKIMLLISIIIAFGLASAYLVNLRPDMDGFWVNILVARWIYGDNGWSFNLLYNGFSRSMIATIVLFFINTGLDIYVITKSK